MPNNAQEVDPKHQNQTKVRNNVQKKMKKTYLVMNRKVESESKCKPWRRKQY